jgi:hypothetical protein
VSQQSAHLGQHLGIGEMKLGDGVVRAFSHTTAATVTFGSDHFSRLRFRK